MGDARHKEAFGEVSEITENENTTVKRVLGEGKKDYAFEFPTAEQLDKDATSADQTVAEKAKRLKRFGTRFEEALNHRLKISVSWIEPTSLRLTVPAENIALVGVTRHSGEWRE
jgi:hypothetical protein